MNESELIREEFRKFLIGLKNEYSDIEELRNVMLESRRFYLKLKSPCLFRYRPLETKNDDKTISAFKNDQLFLSSPLFFNDPHDCMPYVNEVDFNNSIRKKTFLSFGGTKTGLKNFKNYVRILCFSEKIDSTLMWAHYANSHKGFALEYDVHDLFSEENFISKFGLYPVIYSEVRYDMTKFLLKFLRNISYKDYCSKMNIDFDITSNLNLLDIEKPFLYKSKDWKYENEWRIIRNRTSENEEIKVKGRPLSLYLGENIDEKNKEILIKIATKKKIKVYQMKINNSLKTYEMKYELINTFT